MTVLRITTDIYIKEFPTDELIEKISESTKTYVRGVVTSLQLEGDEHVCARPGHVHTSTEDEMCVHCRGLARDEIN